MKYILKLDNGARMAVDFDGTHIEAIKKIHWHICRRCTSNHSA